MDPLQSLRYLGDSVYAKVDGDLILTTRNGPESDPSNTIQIHAEVLHHLMLYLARFPNCRSIMWNALDNYADGEPLGVFKEK